MYQSCRVRTRTVFRRKLTFKFRFYKFKVPTVTKKKVWHQTDIFFCFFSCGFVSYLLLGKKKLFGNLCHSFPTQTFTGVLSNSFPLSAFILFSSMYRSMGAWYAEKVTTSFNCANFITFTCLKRISPVYRAKILDKLKHIITMQEKIPRICEPGKRFEFFPNICDTMIEYIICMEWMQTAPQRHIKGYTGNKNRSS